MSHILSCKRIISNFEHYCNAFNIDLKIKNQLLKNLKEYLKYKVTKIRPT